MIRRPPRSTPLYSSAASDVYKRQLFPSPLLKAPLAYGNSSTPSLTSSNLPFCAHAMEALLMNLCRSVRYQQFSSKLALVMLAKSSFLTRIFPFGCTAMRCRACLRASTEHALFPVRHACIVANLTNWYMETKNQSLRFTVMCTTVEQVYSAQLCQTSEPAYTCLLYTSPSPRD